VDQVIEQFGRQTRDTRSLVVSVTTRLRITGFAPEEWEGTARFLRTGDGGVSARYEAKPKDGGTKAGHWSAALLVHDDLYLLNPTERTAVRLSLAGRDKLAWLQTSFPFVVFLDPARLRRDFRLRIEKQDEWYTYLGVEPKNPKHWGWMPDAMLRGRAVVQNKATDRIPAGVPHQLWYSDDGAETLIEVREWRTNAADRPKAGDFVCPEKLPGWKVVDWPWPSEVKK
jgi:hypothetical protein